MYGLYATSALAVVDFVFCVILAVCFYRRSRRNSKNLTRDLESVSAGSISLHFDILKKFSTTEDGFPDLFLIQKNYIKY